MTLKNFDSGDASEKCIIGVDIGTTAIKACLFDSRCRLVDRIEKPMKIEFGGNNRDGLRAEIDPKFLWTQFCSQIKYLIARVRDPKLIAGIGLCCQRNTFICWNKKTGKPCHKFVTWEDCRAREACQRWNSSFIIKLMNFVAGLLYFVTRQPRFKAAQIFSFLNAMVTHRMLVTLEGNQEMIRLLEQNKLGFGCLETWLIYKLSRGNYHITEPSNASSTGLFDPYIMDWGYHILSVIGFPISVLPPHTYTAGLPLAYIDAEIFGVPITVAAVAGDQQSALFACGCWRRGDITISLGTGSFVDVNTGNNPHSSLKGLYPLVGWKLPDSTFFVAEGCAQDTALVLNWARSVGLFEDVRESSQIAESCEHSGLYFIPAFGGIKTPINDDSACCSFLGIRPDTTKNAMVRSILESIAFRVFQIWKTVYSEIDIPDNKLIRCCGGVSSNDFICQMISTLIESRLERIREQDSASVRGVAMMAGITCDLWTKDSLYDMVVIERAFLPDYSSRQNILNAFDKWESAMKRCLHFYQTNC